MSSASHDTTERLAAYLPASAETKGLIRKYVAEQRSRESSTAALREAADSLANAADACVMGHCNRDDMMPAIRALRSALTGEKSEDRG